MGMGPDQGVAPDAGGVALAAPDHRLLHDDDLLAELHPAALGGHHRTKQDPAVLPDDHIAADHGVGRHIGRRGHLRPSSLMLDEHDSLLVRLGRFLLGPDPTADHLAMQPQQCRRRLGRVACL
jgi:hypothetical protein